MEENVISSHIFIFPFRWDLINEDSCLDISIDKRLDVDEFISFLSKDEWQEDECVKKLININESDSTSDYNTYSYFYENVRSAIWGKSDLVENKVTYKSRFKNIIYFAGWKSIKKRKEQIVRCFNYRNIDNNSKYIIKIFNQEREYELKIVNIKLKVYDTGIATLSYFLENYDNNDENDILKINDFGRRIYPQFKPTNDAKRSFLANKLILKLQGKQIEEDFETNNTSLIQISNTIMKLLGEKFICRKNKLNQLCKKGESGIFIKPVIDDRMFVICYYNDDLKSYKIINDSNFLDDDFWYQLVFVDNSGPTCKNANMKKEFLLNSTYARWSGDGTLFGISRYSFVILCDEKWFSKNILFNHINTLYYEMILIALVQRASILRFSDEISTIANTKSKSLYYNIKKLQEYYIRFINTLYFKEVTAQEQGIELYDKILDFMRIEKEIKRLDENIDEIQRYQTLQASEKLNEFIRVLTIGGLGIAFLSYIATLGAAKFEHFIPQKLMDLFSLSYSFFNYVILPLIIFLIVIICLIRNINGVKK